MPLSRKYVVLISTSLIAIGICLYLGIKFYQYQKARRNVLSSYEWQDEYLRNVPDEIYSLTTVDEVEIHLQSRSISILGAAIAALEDIQDPRAIKVLKDLWKGHISRYEIPDDKVGRFNIPMVRLYIAKSLCKRDPASRKECIRIHIQYFATW